MDDYDGFWLLVGSLLGTDADNSKEKLDKEELQMYNRLMKGVDDAHTKGHAKSIRKGVAYKNVQNNEMLQNFIRKNAAMIEPTSNYKPLEERSGSMLNLSSRDSEPSATASSHVRFS